MKKPENIEKFVEKKLDQISSAGEHVGESIGFFGQLAKRTIVATGILVVFGLAAFIWAIFNGIQKRKP